MIFPNSPLRVWLPPKTPYDFYRREIAPLVEHELELEDEVSDRYAYAALLATLKGARWTKTIGRELGIVDAEVNRDYTLRRGKHRFTVRFEQPLSRRRGGSAVKRIARSTLSVKVEI